MTAVWYGDMTASGGPFAWDVGTGELFTSQTAKALKETYEHILAEEDRANAQRLANLQQQTVLARSAPEYPRWMVIRNTSSTGNTLDFQQTAITGHAACVYRDGKWEIDNGQLNPMPEPVTAVKRCTCGGASVGGGHSHWCDISG